MSSDVRPQGTAATVANISSAAMSVFEVPRSARARNRRLALILLLDPDAAVREEAYQLVLEHTDSDVNGIRTLALNDSSARVRQAVADLIAEQSGE